MSLLAKLKSAEVSLEQNRPDDAIQICRRLIDATDTPQLERAALRIMGQAYKRKKEHQSAVYCFAGMLPTEFTQDRRPDNSAVTTPERGNRPSAERHDQ